MVSTAGAEKETTAVEVVERVASTLAFYSRVEPSADLDRAKECLCEAQRWQRYRHWSACINNCRLAMEAVHKAVSDVLIARFGEVREQILAELNRAREIYPGPELGQLTIELRKLTDWFYKLEPAAACEYSVDTFSELARLRERAEGHTEQMKLAGRPPRSRKNIKQRGRERRRKR